MATVVSFPRLHPADQSRRHGFRRAVDRVFPKKTASTCGAGPAVGYNRSLTGPRQVAGSGEIEGQCAHWAATGIFTTPCGWYLRMDFLRRPVATLAGAFFFPR